MGFMDKVKAQAEQAMVKGQQAVAQGQNKLGEMQSNKAAEALLRELGAAYYASQRSGGSPDAVAHALSAVDAHVAQHGPIEPSAGAGMGSGYADAGPTAGPIGDYPAGSVPQPPVTPPAETGGGFNLDSV